MLTLIALAHIFDITLITQSAVTFSRGIKHLIIWLTTASTKTRAICMLGTIICALLLTK